MTLWQTGGGFAVIRGFARRLVEPLLGEQEKAGFTDKRKSKAKEKAAPT